MNVTKLSTICCGTIVSTVANAHAQINYDPDIHWVGWANMNTHFELVGWSCYQNHNNFAAENIILRTATCTRDQAGKCDETTPQNPTDPGFQQSSHPYSIRPLNSTLFSCTDPKEVRLRVNDSIMEYSRDGSRGIRIDFKKVDAGYYYTKYYPNPNAHHTTSASFVVPFPRSEYEGSIWVNNDAYVHNRFAEIVPSLPNPTSTSNLGRSGNDVVAILSELARRDTVQSNYGKRFNGYSQNVIVGDFALWDSSYQDTTAAKTWWNEIYYDHMTAATNQPGVFPCLAVDNGTSRLANCDSLFALRASGLGTDTALDAILSAHVKRIISFRLNDHHQLKFYAQNIADQTPTASSLSTSREGRVYTSATPEYGDYNKLCVENGYNPEPFATFDHWTVAGGTQFTFDFNDPCVITHKTKQLRDLALNTDADVYEIDFLRSQPYFETSLTTAQRRSAMEDAIEDFLPELRPVDAPNQKVFAKIPVLEPYLRQFGLKGLDLTAVHTSFDGVILSLPTTATLGTLPNNMEDTGASDPNMVLPDVRFVEVFDTASVVRTNQSGGTILDIPLTSKHLSTLANLIKAKRIGQNYAYDGINWFNYHYAEEFGEGFTGPNFSFLHDSVTCARNPICFGLSDQVYLSTQLRLSGVDPQSIDPKVVQIEATPPITGWDSNAGVTVRLTPDPNDITNASPSSFDVKLNGVVADSWSIARPEGYGCVIPSGESGCNSTIANQELTYVALDYEFPLSALKDIADYDPDKPSDGINQIAILNTHGGTDAIKILLVELLVEADDGYIRPGLQ
ncbi:MAG: hypothetical protein AAGH90_06075 [Pseudomonadota bacterium]